MTHPIYRVIDFEIVGPYTLKVEFTTVHFLRQ